MATDTIVVVGAGTAGGTAVTELRKTGYAGRIVMFGAEQHPPYERPPLSKGYLLGKEPIGKAFLRERGWYDEHDVDLRLGTTVTGIDRDAHVVGTKDGEQGYDALLLATGAAPRRLPLADQSGAPVAYLRTIEDSDRIKAAFGQGRRLVVVGGGWIGLEVAAAAREAGTDVTVLEMADLPLLGVLGAEVATVFADLHREHGVDLRLGHQVAPADFDGADLVVVGVGAIPSTDLATAAGLAVDNGVLVDERLRTSDPAVLAVGDLANQLHPRLQRRIRVEHWDTAIHQAKVAAHNLNGGSQSYDRLPYFFTDQYDLGMEYVGSGSGHDQVVVRGDVHARVFRAFWVNDGTVVAGMHVNDWDAMDAVRDQVGRPLDDA
ncbi:MAG TPA: FAD-dependent oxidoreductase [Dermatophilaceae bacterium]|nr:FAD-dependent oxidoreductase [Dermatophilaceae bacterium]